LKITFSSDESPRCQIIIVALSAFIFYPFANIYKHEKILFIMMKNQSCLHSFYQSAATIMTLMQELSQAD